MSDETADGTKANDVNVHVAQPRSNEACGYIRMERVPCKRHGEEVNGTRRALQARSMTDIPLARKRPVLLLLLSKLSKSAETLLIQYVVVNEN